MSEKYGFMDDCIHLHACRLLAMRYRYAGSKHVARFCNEECGCYQTFEVVDSMVPSFVADKIANEAVYLKSIGHSEDDLCVEVQRDMVAASVEVGYIVNGPYCDDENGVDRC